MCFVFIAVQFDDKFSSVRGYTKITPLASHALAGVFRTAQRTDAHLSICIMHPVVAHGMA